MLTDSWAAWMIQGAWQALAVSVVILLAVAAGRRWPARLREGLLATATLKFLVPPFIAAPTAAIPWVAGTWILPAIAGGSSGPVVSAESGASIGGGLAIALLGIWAAGVFVVAAGAARASRRVRTWRGRAVAAPAAAVERACALSLRLGLHRAVQLLVSDEIDAPLAAGVFRPVVLLPRSMASALVPEDLDAVLAHELSHHRHHHLAWGWLRVTACALWWWHPGVWLVARRLRHVQEEVCDDAVVHAGVMAADRYCEVLVRAAAVAQPSFAGSAAFADRLHPLGARIRRLLAGPAPARGWPWVNGAAVLIVAVLLLPGVLPSAATPRAVNAGPWAEEPPVVTAIVGIAEMADVNIERLLSALPLGSQDVRDPAAARVREQIADVESQKAYDTIIASGAPEHVARNVARSINRSIRENNRRFWRDLGRMFRSRQ